MMTATLTTTPAATASTMSLPIDTIVITLTGTPPMPQRVLALMPVMIASATAAPATVTELPQQHRRLQHGISRTRARHCCHISVAGYMYVTFVQTSHFVGFRDRARFWSDLLGVKEYGTFRGTYGSFRGTHRDLQHLPKDPRGPTGVSRGSTALFV